MMRGFQFVGGGMALHSDFSLPDNAEGGKMGLQEILSKLIDDLLDLTHRYQHPVELTIRHPYFDIHGETKWENGDSGGVAIIKGINVWDNGEKAPSKEELLQKYMDVS